MVGDDHGGLEAATLFEQCQELADSRVHLQYVSVVEGAHRVQILIRGRQFWPPPVVEEPHRGSVSQRTVVAAHLLSEGHWEPLAHRQAVG
jgi:hypothetical protein